jgi:hypothetical protein
LDDVIRATLAGDPRRLEGAAARRPMTANVEALAPTVSLAPAGRW